jgi:hypothetical protein
MKLAPWYGMRYVIELIHIWRFCKAFDFRVAKPPFGDAVNINA